MACEVRTGVEEVEAGLSVPLSLLMSFAPSLVGSLYFPPRQSTRSPLEKYRDVSSLLSALTLLFLAEFFAGTANNRRKKNP